MVASAAEADALIICSDIDGLYDKNPHEHDDAQLANQLIPLIKAFMTWLAVR